MHGDGGELHRVWRSETAANCSNGDHEVTTWQH